MSRGLRRSTGQAVAVALVVLVLVGAVGTAIAVTLQLETRTSLQESRRIRLVALSDAALAEALAKLDGSGRFKGAAEHQLDKGTISSSVRTLGLDRYEIVATATLSGWRQETRAEVDTSGSTARVVSWRVIR